MRFKFNYKILLSMVILCLSNALCAQTDDQITDFTKAAKFDDASEVKLLLSRGVNPNTLDPNGNPMLFVAIREKSYKVIDLLLSDKLIDVNLPNKSNETPLMIASIAGDLIIDKQLVSRGAEVNRPGWTPLHYACTTGKLEVAQYLVANGAMVNALSPSHTTPLMMAVNSGNDLLIKYLLDKGADLRMRNTAGYSAIDIAELFSKDDIRAGLMSRWLKLYKQPYPGGPIKSPG